MLEPLLIYFTVFVTALVIVAFIRSNNILTIILLNGVFSLFTVLMYLLLDAPDVAMTEACVGVLASIFSVYTVKYIYKKNFLFFDKFNPLLFGLTSIIAILLMSVTHDLPNFGQAAFNPYYLENTAKDTGIPSVVTSILASYRGYDTLLETLVVLVGSLSVLLIKKESIPYVNINHSKDTLITKLVQFLFPLLLLFALYIQFHGEVSPGGGFQAGVIIASAFIIYAMAFGEENLQNLISFTKLQILAVAGVGIYLITGLISILKKTAFLNYNVLASEPILGQKIGIIIVELGVGLSVSASMLIIYLSLLHASDQSKL